MEQQRRVRRYPTARQKGCEPIQMQSRELSQDNSGARSEAIVTSLFGAKPTEPNNSTTLTVAVLLKLLARRIFVSSREQGACFARAFSRIRNRTLPSPDAGVWTKGSDYRLHGRTERTATLRQNGRQARRLRWPKPELCLALTVFAALAPVAYIIYCVATIPLAGGLSFQPSSGALVIEADDGRPFATRGIFKGEKISAERVPPVLSRAVTAIEDRRFYQHSGVDLLATMRAMWHDLVGHRLEGASTITQQLARNLYLSPERTLRRKVQEAVIAVWLEFHLSKEETLARYLNTVYFGDSAYGADAAAKRYFGKNAQELTLSEAAMLAGVIRAPSALEPKRHFDRARERADVVLDAMVKNGAISQEQAAATRNQPAALRIPSGSPPGSNYFIDTAAADVKSLIGPNAEDLTIRTTMNRQMQNIAERVVAKHLAIAGKVKNVHQAALVAMTTDGAILAMVGGRDYNESQFNRATQAQRQPGSLFKLFVYLAAMRKGLTPDTVMVDRPVSIGDWEPENYGDRYHGSVTLRTAFAQSLNSIAVQLAEAVGVQTVIDTAKQLGIRSDLPAVPSVALGAGEITLLDMTRAFAAVASNATKVDAHTIREIRKSDQAIYTKPAATPAPPGDPLVHTEMIDLLSSVVRDGTGRAARLDGPVAGKTGTSQDYRNAWFVGFTPDLVVGVWVGNDDNAPMNAVTGGSLPAAIWHDFVNDAKAVRRPNSMPTTASGSISSTSSAAVIRGSARVLDGGALEVQGQIIQLAGVDRDSSRYAYVLRRVLRHREVTCTPGDGGRYNCRVGNLNLSELVSPSGRVVSNTDTGAEVNFAEEQDGNARWRGRHRIWPRRFFDW
jgi:1A family penicillin-binding protein